MGSPATFVVLVVVIGIAVLGLILIALALRTPRTTNTCPRAECGHENVRAARFCARCGATLAPSHDQTGTA